MDVPHVKREDYQLTDISDDGYLSLMTDSGELREDLKIPDGDLGTQLRSEFDAGKELLVSICMSYSLLAFLLTYQMKKKTNILNLTFQCTVLKSCGEEVVIAVKTNTALEKN